MGLPTVIFFQEGVFDEYDYWAGTVSLVVFALAETILFSWIFGIDKGWDEINRGADMRVPSFYKPIIKYVTPLLLLFVFMGAMFTPKDNDWKRAFTEGWELDKSSIIGNITHQGLIANKEYVADVFESEVAGVVAGIRTDRGKQQLDIADAQTGAVIKTYEFTAKQAISVSKGESVEVLTPLATGKFYNKVLYTDLSRLYLVALFVFIALLVRKATRMRRQTGREA
jgi:hypothetical protein